MKKPIKVMVTGIGGGGHGEQILKALLMAETNYEIVGGDMSSLTDGLTKVDHPYILPPASDPEYIDTVLKVCKRHDVQALFHGSEPELKVMNRHRQCFIDNGILLPINPSEVIEMCMDKSQTMRFLEDSGFTVPHYATIKNMAALEEFDTLPAVLKPSVGGGGSANIFLAQSKEELLAFGRILLSIYSEFIVQAYVGTPESEYTVGVLTDMDGVLINSIAVRRNILSSLSSSIKVPNRTSNDSLGSTLVISSGISQGEIGTFPEVCHPCEGIAQKLGAQGAINIQCRLVEGTAYVFEINPRFSGTTSLRAMVGYNEPDILIRRHIMGEDIPIRFPYESGTIVRGLSETLIKNTTYPNSREL